MRIASSGVSRGRDTSCVERLTLVDQPRKLPLLKRVVALAGDVVSVSSSGVSINGQLLPNSAPLFDDEAGRPLTMAELDHFRLETDQAFLMGVTPTSGIVVISGLSRFRDAQAPLSPS